jgi:hypothetical protein
MWHEGETRFTQTVVMGKPVRKRPLGEPKCKWDENIKMNLYEIGWGHILD